MILRRFRSLIDVLPCLRSTWSGFPWLKYLRRIPPLGPFIPPSDLFSILQRREAIIRQTSNLAWWFFFCLFCEHTHRQIPICIATKRTEPQKHLTARSAMNADTKFCAPMLCQSLASRKKPPRSSWTRSIWRVINTAWVTPRYRTPAVVHVVAVSRRANAIADLSQTARGCSRGTNVNSRIPCGHFRKLSRCSVTAPTIYSPTSRYKKKGLKVSILNESLDLEKYLEHKIRRSK